MAYEQLIVDLDGAVATVRLNNPDKLNALSNTLSAELFDCLTRLRDDAGVRAVVVTGEGRGFCVGADLGALQEPYLKGERPKLSGFLRDGYNKLIPLFTDTPKPVLAAVNGVAAGAGLSLALACDVRIASEASSYTMAFVKIGLVPDSGASYLLPRTIGMAEALRLSITGERIDAAEALRIGLIHEVVAPSLCLSRAQELAGELAALPTAAIGLTKRLFRAAALGSLEDALESEADVQDQAAASDDHIEGVGRWGRGAAGPARLEATGVRALCVGQEG
jgi:2-(1,2-epoxy-1,2-dihydrophenyl)acetyl-CoA isomerase